MSALNIDEELLRDVRFESGDPSSPLVLSGQMYKVPDSPHHRIYVLDDKFSIVEWSGCAGGYADLWADPDVVVNVLASGVCYFPEDGVRHVWIGDREGGGYIYYPSLSGIARALLELERLCAEGYVRQKLADPIAPAPTALG
jgi:hypothetical protein